MPSTYGDGVSKAFTKEDDDAPPVAVRRHRVPVPEGVPNYLTVTGARVLREEVSTDEVRSQELAEHLSTAVLVEPDPSPDRVKFGTTVELDDGAVYQIVGVLEADPRAGKVSWLSPIAKALLGARVGDAVKLPRGEVEVVALR